MAEINFRGPDPAVFANRLRSEMAKDRRKTITRLSELTGVETRTFSQWRNGDRIPKGEHVWLLAQALDVTTDWLLGAGRDDVPERRGRRRAETYLTRELTGHLRAAAAAAVRTEFPSVEASDLRVEGPKLLNEFTAIVAARALRNVRRARRNTDAASLTDVLRKTLLALSEVAASALPEDEQRVLARELRLVFDQLEELQGAAVTLEEFEPGVGLRWRRGMRVAGGDLSPELRALVERHFARGMDAAAVNSPLPFHDAGVRLDDEERSPDEAARLAALLDTLRAQRDRLDEDEQPPADETVDT